MGTYDETEADNDPFVVDPDPEVASSIYPQGGLVAYGTPPAADDGAVAAPAMTPRRAWHVVLKDTQGNDYIMKLQLPPDSPGSSVDNPLYVQSFDGQTFRIRLEGGNVGSIDKPISISGPVNVVLPDGQIATLTPQKLPVDATGRVPVVLPPADAPLGTLDNPIAVQSMSGDTNRVKTDGGWIDNILQDVSIKGRVTAALADIDSQSLNSAALNSAIIAALLRILAERTTTQVAGSVVIDGGTVDIGNTNDPVTARNQGIVAQFGVDPVSVASGRADMAVTKYGALFTLGGHPNVKARVWSFTAAQTNAVIVTGVPGKRIVVTEAQATVDGDNTVTVAARVGFAQATLGALTANSLAGVDGELVSHPDIAPGSGVVSGDGTAVIGISADGDSVLLTSDAATGGSLRILLRFFFVDA